MQIVAHTGPNGNVAALAAQSHQSLVAIAVRNSVLVYQTSADFVAQIRAVGRGTVAALAFCPTRSLDHLLAVGTTQGFVRIFDVQTRRIVANLLQPPPTHPSIIALRFVPTLPNVLLIASADASITAYRYDAPAPVRLSHLSLAHCFSALFVMHCIPGKAPLVVVAGRAKHPPDSGMLAFVRLGKHPNVLSQFVVSDRPVHDISLRVRNHAADGTLYSLVAISGSHALPMLFTSKDAQTWLFRNQQAVVHDADIERGKRSRNTCPTEGKRGNYRAAVSWCDDHTVLASDAKGTLNLWRYDSSETFVMKTSHKHAHMRQVFAIVPTGCNGFYCSISMDHSLAAWRIDALTSSTPNVTLMWRTIGTAGSIRSLAISDVSSSLYGHDPTSQVSVFDRIISFTSSDCKIMCIAWNKHTDRYAVAGVVSPSASSSGKRKRTSISYLVEYNKTVNEDPYDLAQDAYIALFGSDDGMVGVLGYCDGRLAFTEYKGARAEKVKSWRLVTDPVGTNHNVLSVDCSNKIEAWRVPQTAFQVVAKRSKAQKTESTKRQVVFRKASADITAICPLSSNINDDYLLLMGAKNGKLSIVSQSDPYPLKEIDSGLASVTSIACSEDLHTVAVSDLKGGLAVFHMDVAPNKDQDKQVLSRKHIVLDACKTPISLLSWSKIGNSEQLEEQNAVFLVSVPEKGDALIWQCNPDGSLTKRAELKGHYGPIRSVAWFSNTHIFTGGDDGTVRRWHIDSQPRI